MPARHGFYLSPAAEQESFNVYADTFAQLLGDGAHLVGHSYGAIVALLVAARRPEAVYSLTVSEAPAFGLVRGQPEVEKFIARLQNRLAVRDQMTPEAFTLQLNNAILNQEETELNQREQAFVARRGIEANMREVPPWEADIPLEKLARSPFPKLVFLSRTDPKHEAVCEVLVQRLVAEHTVISEAGHVIPRTGQPFNDRLRTFLRAARPQPQAKR